ncbi:MAG: hypothetical protein V4721_00595 [Bacteroidota bacterium]
MKKYDVGSPDNEILRAAHKIAIASLEAAKERETDKMVQIAIELVLPLLKAAPDLLDGIELALDDSAFAGVATLKQLINLTSKARGR